ncbi:hypothetical protein KK083_16140 [Fulvivirgaceae bacterium PWU4]|uniref:Beta-lactamase-inhibitor-like PepSY-like domain-containing protein n=1 Tax=Chryseosolibacter histidini TaxID=2782349 RepID=A0AAP2GJJ4_9BACT|nr:PepSY-like domain-containing protein [Chryseosolibacter histidini]MBT1698421.1 hypothetical protein [Chryseosolibacter histidini]
MKRCILFLLLLLLLCHFSHAQKVDEKDVPANIAAAVKARSGGSPVTMWVRDQNRGKYIATLISPTAFKLIEVDMKGQWLGTQTALQEVDFPAAPMKTIREKYLSKGYEGSNYVFVEEPGRTYYTVDVSSEDEDLAVELDASGRILEAKTR